MQNIERRLAALEADQSFATVYAAPTEMLEALLVRHFDHTPTAEELQQLARKGTNGTRT
jgi:hypothetical protein